MQIIETKSKCCGCAACVNVCPQKCVNMCMDSEGFFYPVIDESRCVHCMKCKVICEKKNTSHDFEITNDNVFAAKCKSYDVRLKSSSGGAFYYLAKHIIERNGVVYGAIFDEEFNVKHIRATSINQIKAMMGSKYVQSDIIECFDSVKSDLQSGRQVLFTGTPCQNSAISSYIGPEKTGLILVSLICYGVTSPGVWQDYVSYLKHKSNKKINNISFRSKKYGWREDLFVISRDGYEEIEKGNDNIFFKSFHSGITLRESCFTCEHKGENIYADIIVGDFWGVEQNYKKLDDNLGVSAVILKTKKGLALWDSVKDEFDYESSVLDEIKKKNRHLTQSAKRSDQKEKFYNSYQKSGDFVSSFYEVMPTKSEVRKDVFYDISEKYFLNKMRGWKADLFLADCNIKNVILYACNVIPTNIMICELRNSQLIKMIGICDKNSDRMLGDYYGLNVLSVEKTVELMKNGKADAIIIGHSIFEKDIVKSFMEFGISEDRLFSAVGIIYSLDDREVLL